MKVKSRMSGLKLANIPRFLRTLAWGENLEINAYGSISDTDIVTALIYERTERRGNGEVNF